MAPDAESPEEAVDEGGVEAAGEPPAGEQFSDGFPEDTEPYDGPPAVEISNDYDPSMNFIAVFPVGEDQGATASSVAYYIIEPGKHTGLHSDNAEEVIYVADGTGEAFVTGRLIKFEPGEFTVLAQGIEHDIYANGTVPLRLLSFFPTGEIISTFQQMILPMGSNILSSKPPKPVPLMEELDPNNLPADFPFDLSELGLAPAGEAGPMPSEATDPAES